MADFPTMFITGCDVPPITWQIAKAMIDTVVLRYAEPPYSVLFATEVLNEKFWDVEGGTNVFIINLPFYLDVPSRLGDLQLLLEDLRKIFPYMNIDVFGDNQYIFGDMNFPPETQLVPLTDK